MKMLRLTVPLVLALVLLLLFGEQSSPVSGFNHGQALVDWRNYKALFGKEYSQSSMPEIFAQYYYNYNKNLIELSKKKRRTYTLKQNQFSDRRLIDFIALLPLAKQPTTTSVSAAPTLDSSFVAPSSYDPISGLQLVSQVQDQGVVCSSGWAYAAAKAIELRQALPSGDLSPAPLSAQQLIDCAGSGTGCTTQAPQTAFDYLVGTTERSSQRLQRLTDYPSRNTLRTQGMCVPSSSATTATTVGLSAYARLTDADDASLLRYVAAGYPVVIEYNPGSFEFMHYGSGVFQQPSSAKLKQASHFMTVIGYGTDATSGLDYWLVQNSFGTLWGENGYIRILRSTTQPLAKNAVFPTDTS